MKRSNTPENPVRILIAEDSPTQAQKLVFLLEQQGYSVMSVSNGLLALDAARREKPCLIISDVVMPEMDGYELCCKIKSDPDLSDIPVVLVTTLSDPQDVIRGLECRADSFILKPYDEQYLLSRVQFVLLNRRGRHCEAAGMGVELFFNGHKHYITADRLQILNLLLSTYEAAMQRNKELNVTQDQLRRSNLEMQRLTIELEERVADRTRELEQLNQSLRQEIAERSRAEQALREHHERIRAIFDTALDGIITMDQGGKIVDFNPAAERVFGVRGAEVIGQELANVIVPPATREQHRRGLARYLETGEGPVLEKRMEMEGMRADGSLVSLELSVTRMPGSGPAMFTGFVRDITERQEAQSRLKAQLSRLDLLNRITRAVGERLDLQSIFQVVVRSLEDHLPVDFCSICLYDATEEVLRVTQVGLRSEELALGLTIPERARLALDENGLSLCLRGQLVCEPDLASSEMPFPRQLAQAGLKSAVFAPLLVESQVFGVLVAARKKPNSFTGGECEFLRQLSEHVALAAHQAQLYTALQQAYENLRQTQQTAMQQERLRALGQMASGIAHDINNAISPITLYTEVLLEREANLSGRAREYLSTIQRAIEDVAETVSRMREFYRQREPQLDLTSIDLNRMVQQVVNLTRARWKDVPQAQGIVIHLHTEAASGLPRISGVESEIRDALTNLVLNAVDAMPDGGTLTLRTCSTGDRLHLEVVDTGVGMNEETRRRCLEPFFTTKGERGTGLGLAMVYGMAQRHRGEVEIESAPGSGTLVRLVFPVSGSLPILPDGAASLRPVKRMRILVVDDDPLLLRSVRDSLEADGHVITTADGGQAGIDFFAAAKARSEPFDILITDLGMPYVDGRRVAAAVKEMSPATPVLLLTGWGRSLLAEQEAPANVDCVLSKPPKLQELRAALARFAPATPTV